MRTTLDIDDDVLAAAKEQARRQGLTAGQLVSRLLRAAMAGDGGKGETGPAGVGGFRPFQVLGQKLVTNEQIDQLRDQEGL
jgi:hypothetical protein